MILKSIERHAIASLFVLQNEETRKLLLKNGCIQHIIECVPQKVCDELVEKKIFAKGQNIKFNSPQGDVILPSYFLTPFGVKIAKTYGLSLQEEIVPKSFSSYKYVPSHILEKAVNAILAFFAFSGNINGINRIADKLNNLSVENWSSEWKIINQTK